MPRTINLGGTEIGDGCPTYVVSEVGINHNGQLEIAKDLVAAAKKAGVDAVKFQKRTPELCVPADQRDQKRDTPWGYITYLEYRRKVEFGLEEYREIDEFCREIEMPWFVSVWDEPSVDFMEQFNPICYKIPSAAVTDLGLLRKLRGTNRPLILSTGMSTLEQIRNAVAQIDVDNMIITHATSTYPCIPEELNLKMISTLKDTFHCPVGYSGHEVGLIPSVVAVSVGACLVERHITLDRAMWGSDQAASVEPGGFERLVKYIRVTELSLGDGVKKVYDSELPSQNRLRRFAG